MPNFAPLHNATKSALYFSITLFSLFVLLSNSVNAVLKTIWADVGNNWAVAWEFIIQHSRPDALFIVGTLLLVMVLYWTVGGFFAYFDLKTTPHILTRYKIQPYRNEPVSWSAFVETTRVVLFNQLVATLGFMICVYPLFVLRGSSFALPLPSFERFLLEIGISLLIEEALFYYSHRLLHTKLFYGSIHKQHHNWNAPFAICALYAHPVEHIFSNLLPLTAGPLIMGSHLAVMWAWISIAIINTLNVHSGYHLPFAPSPESHDFHHLRFNENFGVLGLLDYIHGTDTEFRRSRQYQDHRTFFAMDEYPDKHTSNNKKEYATS